jgi:diguanylate cyclase (GGDEF)-like protein
MRILIAEDDLVSSRVLAATLRKWGHEVVTTVNGLEAWTALQMPDPPQLAILDWMMPGIEGPEICRRVRGKSETAHIYLILLTALQNKEQMVEGLEAGADDYVSKPFDRHELLARVKVGERIVGLQGNLAQRVKELEAAIVLRQQAENALRNLTLTDDLTDLYNRRGFFNLAEHLLKTARRSHQSSLLIYADLDGLKKINDTFGHAEGSRAITRTAAVLKATFRDSDIVSRLGGDEFAILAQGVTSEEKEILIGRIEENLRAEMYQCAEPYPLSLSVGSVWISHDSNLSIDQLLIAADASMYDCKRAKRRLSNEAGFKPDGQILSTEEECSLKFDAVLNTLTDHALAPAVE